MDPQVGSSFIPKRSLASDTPVRGGGSLFMLIALLVFVASVVTAGAAFVYGGVLNGQITSKSQSLSSAQGAYDLPSINDLIRTDSRINNAKTILQKHVAASAIFAFLSAQTLANVQLTTFDYTLSDDGSAALKLDGVADSFSTVALQSDQLSQSKMLHDMVFSGINVDQRGSVLFSVSATIDPALILYANTLAPLGAQASQPSFPPPQPVSTSTATTGSTSSPQATP